MSDRQPSRRILERDDRAVSNQVGYILAIVIITILMAGLVSATSGLVTQTTEQGTEAELQIIGDRIAAQMLSADRILATDGTGTVVLNPDVPSQVNGNSYTVTYDNSNSKLVLESTGSGVTVSIPLQTEYEIDVESSQASEWRVYAEPSSDQIKLGSPEDAP